METVKNRCTAIHRKLRAAKIRPTDQRTDSRRLAALQGIGRRTRQLPEIARTEDYSKIVTPEQRAETVLSDELPGLPLDVISRLRLRAAA